MIINRFSHSNGYHRFPKGYEIVFLKKLFVSKT